MLRPEGGCDDPGERPVTLRRQMLFWAAAVGFFVLALWLLREILLPFVAGLAIAYLLDPLANRLERAGISRVFAALLIVGVFILFHQPLRFLVETATDIEHQYHLDLIQPLVVLAAVFIFHQYRKAQQAKSQWSSLDSTARRDLIDWINAAADPARRRRRIADACAQLAQGRVFTGRAASPAIVNSAKPSTRRR